LSEGAVSSFELQNIPGAFFYVIVDFFNSDISSIIALNIAVYSITNVAIANIFYRSVGGGVKNIVLVLFLFVIFNPYRIHLSVHVLKDTIIIFGMVYFLIGRGASWLYFVLSYFVSVRSMIYLIAIFNKRNAVFVLLPIVLFLSLQPDLLLSILSTKDQVDMTFREFDRVPNFFEFGVAGAILRAIIWPFLYLTGMFVLLSPTVMYLPIAIGSLFLQLWHFKQYRKYALYFQVYLAMGVMAFMVSGFTSYIRYTLPLITILPILVIRRNVMRFEKV